MKNETLWKAIQLACGTAVLSALCLMGASTATADTLLQYGADCSTIGVASSDAGISGSDLSATVISGSAATGYGCITNSWSVYRAGVAGRSTFNFTMTADVAGTIDTLNFTEFDNDCQEGDGLEPGCISNSWAVNENYDGGGFTQINSFTSPPDATTAMSFTVNQNFNAGDTVAFQLVNTSSAAIYPAQFIFSNIDLEGSTAPEPGTLMLLGSGLIAVTLKFGLRKKA